jgi:endonuclease/exonuclease/phosphatase family metal-dependent hydrolase
MPNHRPPRPYGQLIRSLRNAWKFESISGTPFWHDGAAATAGLNANFRIGIWNICKGAGGRMFEHDYRCLAYQSDIVALQEALLSPRSLRTFCEPGFEVVHAGSYVRSDQLRDGVVTASRSKFSAQKLRIICKHPEPVFKTPKIAFASWHPIPSKDTSLMLVNLHATLVRGAKRAADEMKSLLEALPPHRGPAVLCGDFNTFTKIHFQTVAKILRDYGFEHVPIINDPRKPTGNLDHAFLRGLRLESAQILTTVQSSDHFPLLISLSMP